MTHPCIQNQFQISLHDLTMASVALSAPRMGSACSVSRESHSVLTDTTNKAQNAKMELAIHMHLKEKASVAHGKWQVQCNSVKGVLDGLGINRNKVYYELSKAVAWHNQSDSSNSNQDKQRQKHLSDLHSNHLK
jgi:hypothetical protein